MKIITLSIALLVALSCHPGPALGIATLAAALMALALRIARGRSPVRRLIDDLERWRR